MCCGGRLPKENIVKHIASHYKVLIWIGVCLVCGVLAAWAGQRYLHQQSDLLAQKNKQPMIERVVAAHFLAAGTVLTETHLATRAFPLSAVPTNSVSVSQYQRLLGGTLRAEVAAGDMVLPLHISQTQVAAFSTRLVAGRRAVTMPVDQINSLAGLLRAGDLVDLYVSFDHQRRKITAPLLQGVLVLATDEHTSDMPSQEAGHYATVTFDLAPEDGAKLVAARQTGSITAMLRNPHDAQLSNKGVRGDLATLLGVNQPSAEFKTVPIIYGNKTSRQVRGVDAIPNAPRSAVLDVETPEQLSYQYEVQHALVD